MGNKSHAENNYLALTHWGRVTHICVSKLTIIGSENGLSPSRHQAIIWTNAGLLSIGPLRTNFSDILIKIQHFSLKKMHLKMSSAKRRLCCIGLNVLTNKAQQTVYGIWCSHQHCGMTFTLLFMFVIRTISHWLVYNNDNMVLNDNTVTWPEVKKGFNTWKQTETTML